MIPSPTDTDVTDPVYVIAAIRSSLVRLGVAQATVDAMTDEQARTAIGNLLLGIE